MTGETRFIGARPTRKSAPTPRRSMATRTLIPLARRYFDEVLGLSPKERQPWPAILTAAWLRRSQHCSATRCRPTGGMNWPFRPSRDLAMLAYAAADAAAELLLHEGEARRRNERLTRAARPCRLGLMRC